MISSKMSQLINAIERNIIRIARMAKPDAMGDPAHIQREKERFLRFYQRRNGGKKGAQTASKPR